MVHPTLMVKGIHIVCSHVRTMFPGAKSSEECSLYCTCSLFVVMIDTQYVMPCIVCVSVSLVYLGRMTLNNTQLQKIATKI